MKRERWLFGLLMLVSSSCLDEPECYALNNNIVGVSFKKVADNKTFVIDSLSIVADQVGVELISNSSASAVLLPLNYFTDSTSFTFFISDVPYQIVVGHTSQAQFVSVDCGERFVLSNLHVVSHSFDSVRLVNAKPGVANASPRNIEIFW